MKQFQQQVKAFTQGSRLSLIIGLLLIGAGYAQAQFVAPAGAPPACTAGTAGCDVPLHTGSALQTKKGEIAINSNGVVGEGLRLLGNGTIWSYTGLFGADSPALFNSSATFTAPVTVKNKLTIAAPGTADSSALQVAGASFNIATTNAGFLPPRVADANARNAITTALTGTCTSGQKRDANGLIVYNVADAKLQQWKCTSGSGSWDDIGTSSGSGSTAYDGPWFHAKWSLTPWEPMPAATVPYTIVFDQEISDVDPLSASGFGYNQTTGKFKPSVPGVYVLNTSIASQTNSRLEITISRIRAGVTTNIASGQGIDTIDYASGNNAVSVVTDALAGDEFFVRFTKLNNTYAGGRYDSSYELSSTFSGYRLSNGPVTLSPVTYTIDATPPPGAIMYFDTACPSGWSVYTPLNGRYAVGATTSIGSTVGTALYNLENRPTGQHSHSIPLNIFYGTVSAGGSAEAARTTGATAATGLSGIPGTNAPYIQLSACKKN